MAAVQLILAVVVELPTLCAVTPVTLYTLSSSPIVIVGLARATTYESMVVVAKDTLRESGLVWSIVSSTAVSVTGGVVVAPAAMVSVVPLIVYSPATAEGSVTVRSSSQAWSSVAVIAEALTRPRPGEARSHMVAGAAATVTALRCFVSTWLPKSRTAYSVVVPKSHGSSFVPSPSTSTFQLA